MSGPSSFLGRLLAALDAAGVPHMLAGSFASSIHGSPRSTQDIDIVIDPTFQSLDRLLALLAVGDDYVDADVARAKLGESERKLRDVQGIIEVQGDALDRTYIERWLDDLAVRDLWERLQS